MEPGRRRPDHSMRSRTRPAHHRRGSFYNSASSVAQAHRRCRILCRCQSDEHPSFCAAAVGPGISAGQCDGAMGSALWAQSNMVGTGQRVVPLPVALPDAAASWKHCAGVGNDQRLIQGVEGNNGTEEHPSAPQGCRVLLRCQSWQDPRDGAVQLPCPGQAARVMGCCRSDHARPAGV